MTTNEELKKLMKRYNLKSRDIAAIIGYSAGGVDRWLLNPECGGYRHLKPVLLQAIKLAVKEMA